MITIVGAATAHGVVIRQSYDSKAVVVFRVVIVIVGIHAAGIRHGITVPRRGRFKFTPTPTTAATTTAPRGTS